MKTILSIAALAVVFSTSFAHATCTSAAAWAAESYYGNDPAGPSKVTTLDSGSQYQVTVGEHNSEDGPHTYIVTFKNGVCDPKTAAVTESEK